MNEFAGIFRATAAFLRAKGISPQVSSRPKASQAAVERLQRQTGVPLPESFSVFHTGFADGFEFMWEKSESVWGCFSMPSIEQLRAERQGWVRSVEELLDASGNLRLSVARESCAEAFEITGKMKSWLPFWHEGNGDHFCVDTATGQIVYDQHDWYDGFGSITRTNGIVAGDNLADFVEKWSRYCFRRNKSQWWGTFAEFGVIRWEPEYFDSEFSRGG